MTITMRLLENSKYKTAIVGFFLVQMSAPSAFASLDSVCQSSDQTLSAIRADSDQTLWAFIEQVCGAEIGNRIKLTQGQSLRVTDTAGSDKKIVSNESSNDQSVVQASPVLLSEESSAGPVETPLEFVVTPTNPRGVHDSGSMPMLVETLRLSEDLRGHNSSPTSDPQPKQLTSVGAELPLQGHAPEATQIPNNPRFALIGEVDEWPSVELPEPIIYRPTRAPLSYKHGQSYVVASNGDRIAGGLLTPPTWSMSVKFWNQQMDYGDGSLFSLVSKAAGNNSFRARRSTVTAITPVLSLSVRKDSFVGVLNAMPRTSLPFTLDLTSDGESLLLSDTDERTEFDLGVGWSPDSLPGFAILVGGKHISHGPRVPGWSGKFRMNAPYIGLSYNRFISDKSYMYLNAAGSIGGKQELEFSLPEVRITPSPTFNFSPIISAPEVAPLKEVIESKPNYLTGEVGLGRVLDNGGSVSIGYRYQQIKMVVRNEYTSALDSSSLKEVGKGLTLSVGLTF